ncbi:putative CLEC16A [Toxoplasma gondii MAS]|uniref:Putative CLEC16A n=1 Tax=Toxoplasma gondii MAS TaxID=943118 RepID=A0A086QYS7_TOXGO|nr:putative CLEC16A [Toxoplasma gondii MAS]
MWFWGSAGFASGAFKDAVSHHGSSKQDFFTEGHLQDLFDALHAFDTIDDRNRDAAVEILRQIAELLVWGERHKNEAFFDIFCEQNILSYFVDIVSQPRVANAVKVQLLQTLSILVQNTHRKTAIYYLFSNNYINTLLRTPYDFSNEELVAWYVSFIKGLSLLVNHDTVKLFLNKRAPSFPVFSEAVKFFVHRDSMVRTHVRTVTLSIFKIREPVVEEFLVRHSAFFSHIACYLRAQWAERCRGLRACRRLSPRYHASTTTSTSSRSAASASPCGRDTPGTAACVAALKSGFSECEEFLFYIQDIFGIGVEAYNTLLVERLLLYTYLPLLVGCLCRGAPRETTVRRFACKTIRQSAACSQDSSLQTQRSRDVIVDSPCASTTEVVGSQFVRRRGSHPHLSTYFSICI